MKMMSSHKTMNPVALCCTKLQCVDQHVMYYESNVIVLNMSNQLQFCTSGGVVSLELYMLLILNDSGC